MLYKLPPAGEPITPLGSSSSNDVQREYLGDYNPIFYGSGTAAIAAALVAITRLRPNREPEVLLPAYTCPALVSATLYAGARPVLVDLEQNRPWMDINEIKKKISDRTVAVIPVHLFGIPERLALIQEIMREKNILLIEDSAQYLPAAYKTTWTGDFVILSFGRGKPVTLLGGGVVLAKAPSLANALPIATTEKNGPGLLDAAAFTLKVWVYNRFLSPFLYWLPASLPFLHLGETRFQPLAEISAASKVAVRTLPAALATYEHGNNNAQRMISNMLSRFESSMLVDLPKLCCMAEPPRLVRYPLLLSDTTVRNRLFEALDSAGLGASKMYPDTLPNIPGLENVLETNTAFPNAEHFADSILTLPVHYGVTSEVVEKIAGIFEKNLPRVSDKP